mmetsp:Transcript_36504/g.107828  ORF Transcript_36504/g.107828 Transcript_36504/m.107828 type:complete len:294 (-) Transcript_36504:138-1019(-)
MHAVAARRDAASVRRHVEPSDCRAAWRLQRHDRGTRRHVPQPHAAVATHADRDARQQPHARHTTGAVVRCAHRARGLQVVHTPHPQHPAGVARQHHVVVVRDARDVRRMALQRRDAPVALARLVAPDANRAPVARHHLALVQLQTRGVWEPHRLLRHVRLQPTRRADFATPAHAPHRRAAAQPRRRRLPKQPAVLRRPQRRRACEAAQLAVGASHHANLAHRQLRQHHHPALARQLEGLQRGRCRTGCVRGAGQPVAVHQLGNLVVIVAAWAVPVAVLLIRRATGDLTQVWEQ